MIGGAWIKDGAGAGAGAALIQDGEGSIDAALIEGEGVRWVATPSSKMAHGQLIEGGVRTVTWCCPHQRWRGTVRRNAMRAALIKYGGGGFDWLSAGEEWRGAEWRVK